jgi:hypothetical protein
MRLAAARAASARIVRKHCGCAAGAAVQVAGGLTLAVAEAWLGCLAKFHTKTSSQSPCVTTTSFTCLTSMILLHCTHQMCVACCTALCNASCST